MRSLCLAAVLAACVSPSFTGCSPQPGPWIELHAESLSPVESKQFDAANAAREALFNTLMERLSSAIQEGGPASAISVCKDVAPTLAKEVGQARGLTIGRTSHRLRNPRNVPPAWAEPYIRAQREELVLLVDGASGDLAALFPIKLKNECLQCHGPADQIQPDVWETLQKAYPRDDATGFNEGDLRGWFHVTVPPAI